MKKKNFKEKHYAKLNNTLSRKVKDYAPDKIEVEIGDSKQAEFFPQAKIKRWDNDTNFSIRRDNGARSYVERDGKIVAESNDENVVIYELDPDEQNEDGGLEIEIELSRQPKTNIFDFTLQTKGLDFHYQAPLTPEEIAEGAYRPENVEGSYAVYHQTKRDNRVGGKEYKAGKAFHIYRPKAIDADGNEEWCELNIDEALGILTVTVPELWLPKASYPVRVDPTFGYTSAGGSNHPLGFGGFGTPRSHRRGTEFTSPAQGTLDSISFYNATGNQSGRVVDTTAYVNEKDSVSSGSHGQIASAEAAVTYDQFSGLRTISLASGAITNGSVYILNLLGDGSDMPPAESASVKADSSGGTSYAENITSVTAYSTLKTSPWVISSNETHKYSIYATYTATATSSPPTVTTQTVSSIGETTATGNGNVTDDGGETITERGVCWDTSTGPTTTDSKATSAGTTGAFTVSMTGLTRNTTYYVRAYAINSEGTSYGGETTFDTDAELPTVVTNAVTNIKETP